MSLFFFETGSSIQSIEYLRDSSSSLTFNEVKVLTFSVSKSNNLGAENGIYWFKINKIDTERAILEMRTSHVRDLELYDSDGQIVYEMGDTRFPSYFLNKQNVSFPLYLKASFPLETYFPLVISDESTFARNDKRSLLAIGFFYGTGLALIMASLIFFFIVRNTKFLFFALTTLAILLCLITKDNIFYLFDVPNTVSIYIELVGHYIVGLAATGFMMFYLNVRSYQNWLKWSMLTLSGLSTLSLFTYIFTEHILFFSLVDVTSILTAVFMWILILMIAKGVKKILLIIVYSANIFFLTDIFVLHFFGLSIIQTSTRTIAIVASINFTIMAALLLQSFNRIQTKGVIMKRKIRNYIKELKELSTYKNVQDAQDTYMESLIYQFKLENIEVKVLSEIAEGHSNAYISSKYDLSPERLQNITTALFNKLGIDSSDDLSNLSIS